MIEMRWLVTSHENPKLQYRQKLDASLPTGYDGWVVTGQSVSNFKWTDWIDVPTIEAEEIVNANS